MENITAHLSEAKTLLIKILDLFRTIEDYLKLRFLKNTPFKTKFDKFRVNQIINQLSIIVELLKLMLDLSEKFSCSKSNESFKFYIDLIVKNSIKHIRKYNEDPFQLFPNINLLLLLNQMPVGVCSLKAQDLIWSENNREIGTQCAKIIYSDIKVNLKAFTSYFIDL